MIWEEILEEMRKGVQWTELSQKYRSKSQLYKALHVFLKENGARYQKISDDLIQKERVLKDVKREISEVCLEKEELDEEVFELRQEEKQLSNSVLQ